MKPTLQFRLSQHLTLTPQLQQSIRLLQLSTVELNQEIDRLLMDNPALEREDGAEPEAEATPAGGGGQASETAPIGGEAPEQDWSTSTGAGARQPDEDDDRTFAAPDVPTLRDHLHAQLAMLNLGDLDRALVGVLIEELDDDGRLTQSIDEIAAMFPPEAQIGAEELAIALRHLQNMEPAGVGARTTAECLALQIRAAAPGGDDPVARLALAIVESHLELLGERDYTRLRSATGADDASLRAAQHLIRGLNPHPGAEFARDEARYVIPDVVVRKTRGQWTATLNAAAMPRLRLNRLYAELAARARGSGPLSSQVQEARWLIKNVQQRFDTILRVAQAIVERQHLFFEHGEVAMRPLVLREIADTLGLHESTISRVTNQKYMATPRGTFELKYFFGSHVSTDTGGAASSTAIRALIKQLVAAEDAHTPLSDSTLAKLLGQQGIVVARRTVAKYRELLQIPPVNQRKSL